jgi:hypothetical protein
VNLCGLAVIPETFDYLCGQGQCCGETGPTGCWLVLARRWAVSEDRISPLESAHLYRVRRKLIAQLGPDHPFSRDDPEGASS